MGAASGRNEPCRVLDDFVCDAIPGVSVTQTGPAGRGENAPVRVVEELVVDLAGHAATNGAAPSGQRGVRIRIAGNTTLPALLALRAKGYRVWLEYMKVEDPGSPWHPYMPDYQAEKDGGYFSATSPVELLGLVAMWETRGDNWKFQKGEPDILDELTDSAKTFDKDGNEIHEE
jgi:hypothetical protein